MNDEEKTERLIPEEPAEEISKQEKAHFKISKKVIIIAGVLLIIVLALLGYFFYNSYKENEYQKNLDLGMKYLNDGDYENALISFNDAAEISEKHVEIFPLLASSALNNQDYDKAHQAYEKLIELTDDKVEPSLLNARVYSYEGNYDQVNQIINDLNKEYPDNPEVEYAQNTIESGNLAENIQNSGNIVYNYDGTVYFNSTLRSNNTVKGQIYRYNENEDEKPEIILQGGELSGFRNLSLWNNLLYFLDGNDLKSCDLNGKNEKIILSDIRYFYIYQNQIYLEQIVNNHVSTDHINIYDMKGTFKKRIDLQLDSNEKCDSWMIYNGLLYFFTFNGVNKTGNLYSINPDSLEKSLLASYPITSEISFINGMYPYGDFLYLSYLDGADYHYQSINLKTKEQKTINYNENAGMSVNDEYIFFSNFGMDLEEISIYSLKDSKVVQTISLSDYAPEVERKVTGSMTTMGDELTPTDLYAYETVGYKMQSGSFQDIFEMNTEDFETKLFFTNEQS